MTPHRTAPDPTTARDAALLLADLRRLWRAWHERARVAPPAAADVYHQAQVDLEATIEDHGGRRRAWDALRGDLVREVVRALQDPEYGVPSTSPFDSPG